MKIINVIGPKPGFLNVYKNIPTHKETEADHTAVSGNAFADTISISPDAVSLLAAAKEKYKEANELIAKLQRLNEQSTQADTPFDDFAKCLLIAMRIINGDHVPMKDIQFLAETEPEMYANAIMLQRQNDRPEKFDSLLDDKKNDTTTEYFPTVLLEFVEQHIESVTNSDV